MKQLFKWVAMSSMVIVAAVGSSFLLTNVANAAVPYTLNRSGSQITIDWDDVASATSYQVTPIINGAVGTPVQVTQSAYVVSDTVPNTTYLYQVTAAVGAAEPIDLFTTSSVRYALTPPSVSAALTSYNAVTLNYAAVHGAQKYEIYRSTNSKNGFKYIATTAGTTYVDKGLTLGVGYYYIVRSIQVTPERAYYSSWSPVVGKRSVLSKTTLKIAATSYNATKLSFTQVQGASGYKIYRSTNSKNGFKQIATTKSTTYINSALKTGTTYYYKVIPFRDKVNGSVSNMVATKPVLAGTSVKTRENLRQVTVSWSKVSGASGYKVYRAMSKSGAYKQIKVTGSLSFTDTKLADNKLYYYKVVPFRTVDRKQVNGPVSSAAGALTPRPSGLYRASDAGWYVLEVEGAGYWEVCSTTQCNWGTDDTNDFFYNRAYVYLQPGQYLRFNSYGKNGRITHLENYHASLWSSFSKPGYYIIGIDLRAGQYKISGAKDAYYAVCETFSCNYDEIIENNYFYSAGTQYVVMNDLMFLIISGNAKGVRL